MRLRVLLVLMSFVLIISVDERRWSLLPLEQPLPRSNTLAVSLVGYTNGDAIVEVRNRSRQAVHLDYGCAIYAPYSIPDSTDHFIAGYRISNGSPLSPGAVARVQFSAPTNRPHWRAEVAFMGDREQRLGKWLRGTWPFNLCPPEHYPSKLMEPQVKSSCWIAP